MKYLFSIACTAVLVLAVSIAAGGSYEAKLDVDTYVDADNVNQSFSDDNVLWITSMNNESVKEAYLGFVNTFGSTGIFTPEDIESATLKFYATNVENPGEVKAYLIHGAVLDSATWEDKPSYSTTKFGDIYIDKEGEYAIDITPLIREAVETCTEGCPYSVALVAENNASMGFASKESSNGKAILEYTMPE
ncbi:MAG: DNRLRE domain-containing protein [Methanotrichaceae archaeon]|nr:DNRLRE domain-containing protein [Methanotrichaceae archaeon]